MNALTPEQNEIHQRAVRLAIQHKNTETDLIEVLQEVERLKIYKKFGKRSLFVYATEVLGLDDDDVYTLTTIARKAMDVPSLKIAIQQGRLSVSKASRIVSSLKRENARELIDFATSHTRDQIDYEMARRNPRAKSRDRMKYLAEDVIEVKFTMSRATYEKLKRAESLQAQKNQSMQWGEVADAALECYRDKNDPVRKAQRAEKRSEKRAGTTVRKIRFEKRNDSKSHYQRVPLTAAQKHAVFKRDGGRCTHVGLDGKRCNEDKWLDTHHIILVSQGGTNDPENLTTLCSFHHDLAHQLALPIEGQVTWLRSPSAAYG